MRIDRRLRLDFTYGWSVHASPWIPGDPTAALISSIIDLDLTTLASAILRLSVVPADAGAIRRVRCIHLPQQVSPHTAHSAG